MTEYDYGPWQDVPEGGLVQLEGFPDGYKGHPSPRYRILTPKPRREFVVGKWYQDVRRRWRQCIFIENDLAWLRASKNETAYTWSLGGLPRCLPHYAEIDWSASPRDEAPE